MTALHEIRVLAEGGASEGDVIAAVARALGERFDADVQVAYRPQGAEDFLLASHGDRGALCTELADALTAIGRGEDGEAPFEHTTPDATRTLVAPLTCDRGTCGVIRVFASLPTQVERGHLACLASHASLALLLTKQRSVAARGGLLLEALRSIAHTLASSLDIALGFDSVAQALARVIELRRASLVLVDAQDEAFVCASSYDREGRPVEHRDVPISRGVRAVLDGKRIRVVTDLRELDDPDSRVLLEQGIRSTIVVPLLCRGRAIGTLNVGSDRPRAYDGHDAALVQYVADQLARAVEISQGGELEREATDLKERLYHTDRLASLGTLAAGVAHEINNPAAVMLSNLQVMRDAVTGALDDDEPAAEGFRERLQDFAEMLDDNIDAIGRIRSTVDALRGYAQVDESAFASVLLDEVVRKAARMVDTTIRHHTRLTLDLGDVPVVVGDHTKLVQLVTNLLINAADAVEDEGPDHAVISVSTEARDDTAVLTVRDTGRGIPAEDLESIFDPFFTTKSRERGTGLGLALCREIAALHGGRIRVHSEVGQGSVFIVSLPLERRPALATKKPPGPSSRPARPLRVLLVDDEPAILRAFSRVLARRYEVVQEGGGEAAIERLRQDRRFDAIVCDLMMPGADGPAVYRAIKETAPELAARVIFCTGGEVTELARKFTREAACRVLRKPVRAEDLRQAVRDVAEAAAEEPDAT